MQDSPRGVKLKIESHETVRKLAVNRWARNHRRQQVVEVGHRWLYTLIEVRVDLVLRRDDMDDLFLAELGQTILDRCGYFGDKVFGEIRAGCRPRVEWCPRGDVVSERFEIRELIYREDLV